MIWDRRVVGACGGPLSLTLSPLARGEGKQSTGPIAPVAHLDRARLDGPERSEGTHLHSRLLVARKRNKLL